MANYASVIVFFSSDITVWAGVSTQYRATLQFVNCTVMSPKYLNIIINPVIVLLHKPPSPNLIFMDNKAPSRLRHRDWSTSNVVPCTESHKNLWDQLSCHVEAYNSVPQNLNGLRVMKRADKCLTKTKEMSNSICSIEPLNTLFLFNVALTNLTSKPSKQQQKATHLCKTRWCSIDVK